MSISFKHTLKTYLFTGILVTAPVAITVYLAIELIRFIDSSVSGLIPAQYNPETYLPYGIPGLGILLLLLFLIGVGMLTTNFIGKSAAKVWMRFIGRMPVISGFYNALKKIFETILGTGKKNAFRQPVLIQYPRAGLWTIAFITGDTFAGIQQHIKPATIAVYVPTTPNPTSGFLIYVPKKEVIELDIGVDDALKMILSMGIVNPTVFKKKK